MSKLSNVLLIAAIALSANAFATDKGEVNAVKNEGVSQEGKSLDGMANANPNSLDKAADRNAVSNQIPQ